MIIKLKRKFDLIENIIDIYNMLWMYSSIILLQFDMSLRIHTNKVSQHGAFNIKEIDGSCDFLTLNKDLNQLDSLKKYMLFKRFIWELN